MELKQHGKIEFQPKDYLWKYFDVHKFLSFIIEKNLFFTRLDKFEDPLDGLTERTIAEFAAAEGLPSKIEDLNPNFSEEEKKNIINGRQNKLKIATESAHKSQTSQFANCWFISRKESMAMWKLYSNPDSVVIRYSPNDLLTLVKASAESYSSGDFKLFLFGNIIYKEIWPFNFFEDTGPKVEYNAFKKDSSFSHENEFRFVTVTPDTSINKHQSFVLPLGDIEKDNFKIIANPFMKEWKYKNLSKLLMKFNMESKLQKSFLKVKE